VLIGAGKTWATSGFIQQMVEEIRAGQPREVDDVLMRWPVWIEDVAVALDFLLSGGHAGTYHLAGPAGGTRYFWTLETARLIRRDASHLRPARQIIPRKARRPVDSALSTGKIRALG
jgi:dTDP-4-dehydrorhamnose reductase